MSPATSQRFVVTGKDFAPWEVVVEAGSIEEAIRKAEALYLADNIGSAGSFGDKSGITWTAFAFTREA